VIAGISKYVRMMLMPYLRSTALLCYTHFDVPIRKRLRTLDAVSSEVDKLLVYLQLPRFNDLLKGNDTVMSDVVISWCLDFKSLSSSKKVRPVDSKYFFKKKLLFFCHVLGTGAAASVPVLYGSLAQLV